jgi:hypothetical protein
MNNNDENVSVEMRCMTKPMCESTVTNEVSCEYTLPDYLPEIRRLLYVTPTILPPAKYVGGNNAELDGTVDYQVLYVGSDGGLYTAPVSCEYNLNIPLEKVSEFDLNEGVTLFVTSNAENISSRVSGPRRLSIRMRMRSYVRAYGKMPYGERCMGDVNEASVYKLTKESQIAELVSSLSDVLTLSEEISGMGEDVRVIGADGKVHVDEAFISDSGVNARGNVMLKLLCAYDDGRVENILRKLPFDSEIEAEIPAGEEKYCRVCGKVSEISVNVGEGKIICDINALLDTQIGVNRPISYTADIYSTEKESFCEYIEHSIPVMLRSINGNFSQSERIPLSELSIPEGATAVDVCSSVAFENCEGSGGRYVLTGQSRYVLVCEKNGEYSACEVNLPIRFETEGADGALSIADASAEVISCRARVGGENLELDSEISVAAMFMGKENVVSLKSVEFSEPIQKESGELILCYPAPDDSAWTVAKRYSVAPEDVSGDPKNDTYLIIRS